MTMSDETSPHLITDDDREKYGDLTKLNNPKLSDREMAAKVVWLDRQSVDFLGVIYTARDRIMHLAVKVADLEAKLAAAKADIAENDKVIDELREVKRTQELQLCKRYFDNVVMPSELEGLTPFNKLNAASNVRSGARGETHTSDNVWRITTPEQRNVFYTEDVVEADRFADMGHTVERHSKIDSEKWERAERALKRAGFTYLEGAAEWKPPLGKRPVFIEVGAGDYTHWVSLLSKLESPYHDDSFNLVWDEAIGKAIEVIHSNCGDTPKPKAVGYVMQARQVGGDKGFSWTEDNENFPRDIWQRKPVVYMDQDDAEYLEGYLKEVAGVAAEGIKYCKDRYDALVKQERTYGEDKPADTEG